MKPVKLLIFMFLLSACSSASEEKLHERCSKVVDHSVSSIESNDIAWYFKKLSYSVADGGNKPADLEVYEKARGFSLLFKKIKKQLSDSKDLDFFYSQSVKVLDSVYALEEFKKGDLPEIRTILFSVVDSDLSFYLKRSLMIHQIVRMEKEIMELEYNRIGASCLKFDVIKPLIVWDKDTVFEGELLKGIALTSISRRYSVNPFVVVAEDTIRRSSGYYYGQSQLCFSIAIPDTILVDAHGLSTQRWQAKVFYTDATTVKDSTILFKGDYFIYKKCE